VTPPQTHAKIAIDAIKAGKHVAVEKPMCTTLEEATQMVNTAKKEGVLDCYFENLCFAPSYSAAKQIVVDGGVGEVFFMRCGESDGKGIQKFREESGSISHYGVIREGGCHPIMFCRYLYDRAPVSKVYAQTRGLQKTGEEDAAFLTITYSTGQVAWVDTAVYALGTFDDRAEIYGTKGTIIADLYGFHMNRGVKVYSEDGFDPKIGSSNYPAGKGYFGRQKNWSHPMPDEEFALGYFHEQKAFLKSVLAGRRPEVNFADGKATLEVVFAAYKSLETGGAASLPL